DLDAGVQKVEGQVTDLLLGYFHFLETRRDLLARREAAFLGFGHERAQFLDLEDRRFAPSNEQCYSLVLLAQPHSFNRRGPTHEGLVGTLGCRASAAFAARG